MLSLVLSPSKDHYITSSADAKIAMHPFPLNMSVFKTPFKPLKVSATKHAGQQGLSYRSDGKMFATAGWDSTSRVYSSKSLKEVAVLKWHEEGCYATAFASIEPQHEGGLSVSSSREGEHAFCAESSHVSTNPGIAKMRDQKARSTHWLAVGSKDGKISLWSIF